MARAAAWCLALLFPLAALGQGKVRPAGQLSQARSGHTATLLADGRVLVVGGRGADATVELTSAEFYTPKTGKWTAAASLATGRAGHTATLLADGRVLVVGGTGHDSQGGAHRYVALTSVELYEPKTDTWKAGAPTQEARNWHSATLLADGRVLVAGGAREMKSHLSKVELYTPATDSWAEGAPMRQARCLHQAVAVPGGVVVAGGRSNQAEGGAGFGKAVATAERWDAATGRWTALPEMSDARQFHAAVALADGRVLTVGGAATTMLTNLAEWLAPQASAWKQAEFSLSLAHAHHTATLLPRGDVLVVGGESPEALDSALVQRLDAATGRWCLAGQLLASRKKHTATLLGDGRVLLVGGTSAGVPEPTAEVWAPARGACVEPPGPSLQL